jgi:transposase
MQVEWQESVEELEARQQAETDPQRQQRLRVLYRLRQGQYATPVSAQLGIPLRTVQQWVTWYRTGGLTELLRRVQGHGSQGRAAYLSSEQEPLVLEAVRAGQFSTVNPVREWIAVQWGIGFSYGGR